MNETSPALTHAMLHALLFRLVIFQDRLIGVSNLS